MTEAEWLAFDNSVPMLEFLKTVASERKLRLFLCGACRRIAKLTADDRCRGAVEAAEQYATGLISERELSSWSVSAEEVYKEARSRSDNATSSLGIAVSYATILTLSHDKLLKAINALLYGSGRSGHERAAQAELIREVFPNPFRSATFSPSWRTETAFAIATGMYEARDFSAMPILADALQDAGCDSADVLDHCRGPGPHVRGCWVVDMVLGKE